MDTRPDDAALAAAALVLADVLERYHTTPPELLADLVVEMAAAAGADQCTLYVQDYSQELLVPLEADGPEEDAHPIEGTVPGRA